LVIQDNVCNFRLSEFYENELENKIIGQKLPSFNTKIREKEIDQSNGDLTFSSKKKKKKKSLSHIIKFRGEFFNFKQTSRIKFSRKNRQLIKNKNEENLDINRVSKLTVRNKTQSKISLNRINSMANIKTFKCTCEKSKCRKKYCECFANGKKCNSEICKCVNCENPKNFENGKYNLIQNSSVEHVEEIPDQSNKENTYPSIPNINFNDFSESFLNKKKILSRNFCNCTHSKCNKQYCDCFKNNRTCSSLCRCLKCINKEKHKNVYANNITLQSFDHISVSIINNQLRVSNYTEKVPIFSKKSKRNILSAFKSPHRNKYTTPLFTTTCETTASRKISSMDKIVEKINSDGKCVKRKIEMKTFNNESMFDSNAKE
jgi:hypothetical protein